MKRSLPSDPSPYMLLFVVILKETLVSSTFYCMPKKTWSILYSELLYIMGYYFSDIQYINNEYGIFLRTSKSCLIPWDRRWCSRYPRCRCPGWWRGSAAAELLQTERMSQGSGARSCIFLFSIQTIFEIGLNQSQNQNMTHDGIKVNSALKSF